MVPSCVKSIAELYDGIIQALKASDDLVIPKKNGVNFMPEYLKESYDESWLFMSGGFMAGHIKVQYMRE